jgi:hypothetical protein
MDTTDERFKTGLASHERNCFFWFSAFCAQMLLSEQLFLITTSGFILVIIKGKRETQAYLP